MTLQAVGGIGGCLLFIANRPPHETELDKKVAIFGDGNDAIILFEDAALASIDHALVDKLVRMNIKLFVLSADLEARGLVAEKRPEVSLIDYSKAIELIMETYEKNISI